MVNKINCICNAFEEINGFFSIAEFERFQSYIKKLVDDGDLIEIAVTKPYAGFPERWYKCKSCSKIWRLAYPDFPFKGIWRVAE